MPPAPNPTTGRTTLRYALAEAQDVQLVVMDLLGREVARLADGAHQAGDHEAAFDATALPSGLYIVRLRVGDTVQTRRLTITR
ncbi:MAG: T9SS type A sorting domain-containing protein [Bacteroidota bacterium]